eukprot:4671922-Amphidinium_carterae.1
MDQSVQSMQSLHWESQKDQHYEESERGQRKRQQQQQQQQNTAAAEYCSSSSSSVLECTCGKCSNQAKLHLERLRED